MAKRMIIVIGTLLVIVGAIGFIKYQQIRTAIAEGSSYVPPPESVTTVVVEDAQWQGTQHAIGSVAAVQGVTVSADLPGIVSRIAFESGRAVQKGDVLVELDTVQERAQLEAAEAQAALARLNLERAQGLRSTEAISQAEFDRVDAEAKAADANAAAYRAVIDRKTIRAPFSGVLGIRRVNLGQYLSGGNPVVDLQALNPIHVNFSVPQQNVEALRVGTEVLVSADGVEGSAKGRVSAVNSLIDEATRNVWVQATCTNTEGRLRPGMFVEVQVVLGTSTPVVAVPSSAVSFAPYGDSVFIVEDVTGPDGSTYKGVRQQFVKLGGSRGDQVAVLTGLKAGEEVVSSGVFKLRPGAAVVVNNKVQPSNDPAPQPEDS